MSDPKDPQFRDYALRCARLEQAVEYLNDAAKCRAEGREKRAAFMERNALAKLHEIGPEFLMIDPDPECGS